MSRGKLRAGPDAACADCGMPDPAWVSISRGVLICDECCVVHRSLGRHISQVKSLRKGLWSPTQLAMVHALNNNGANAIWEHSLLDPTNAKSGRKKPNPKDPIHPTKADFVRAKHQMLMFVYRPGKDDPQMTEGDVSKQLHSSVRTANLETSLRLLSLGADPNFFHEEKGTSPMHVAAKAGQVSQVELLAVYGADPGSFDAHGKTPVDYARLHHHNDLADRLVELQFELTDRLAHYLCGRKPDHQSGLHFIIPEMADRLDVSEFAKTAKKKLQSLSNVLFEELGMDIYDEMDRRETDAIWLSMHFEADRTVPFLPVNPELSAIRNQGRQKLARFNAREFATLIIDFLTEAKRRQMGLPLNNNAKDRTSSPGFTETFPKMRKLARHARKSDTNSDDEPLYDSVASDEEGHAAHLRDAHAFDASMDSRPSSREKTPDVIAQAATVSPLHGNFSEKAGANTDKGRLRMAKDSKMLRNYAGENVNPVSMELYMDVKKQLLTSQAQIRQLVQNNSSMKQEIGVLQSMLHKLMDENASLRTHVQHEALPNGHDNVVTLPHVQRSPRVSKHLSARPQSMYEPRNYQQTWPPNPYASSSNRESIMEHDYDKPGCIGKFPARDRCCSRREMDKRHSHHRALPPQQEVVRKTEQITKRIQELLISAQEGKHDNFVPCSEKIYAAVLEMATIFPEDSAGENLATMLHQLTTSALRLQMECQSLMVPSVCQSMDVCFITQQVIQCAYDVAKAAKQLVTSFQ